MHNINYEELKGIFLEIQEKVKAKMSALFTESFPKIPVETFITNYDDFVPMYKLKIDGNSDVDNMVNIGYCAVEMNSLRFGTFKQQISGMDDKSMDMFNKFVKTSFIPKIHDTVIEAVSEYLKELHPDANDDVNIPNIEIACHEWVDEVKSVHEMIMPSIRLVDVDMSTFPENFECVCTDSFACFSSKTTLLKTTEKCEKCLTVDKTCDDGVIDLNTIDFEPIKAEISEGENVVLPFDAVHPLLSRLMTISVKNVIEHAVQEAKKNCIGTWEDFMLPTVDDIFNESLGIERSINANFKKIEISRTLKREGSDTPCRQIMIKRPVKCMVFDTPCVIVVDEVKEFAEDQTYIKHYYTISEGYVIFTFNKNGVPTLGFSKIIHNSNEELQINVEGIIDLKTFSISYGTSEDPNDECCKSNVFVIETPSLKTDETPKYSRLYPDEIQRDIREVCQNLRGFVYGAFGIYPEIPNPKTKFLKTEKFVVLCEYKDDSNDSPEKSRIYTNAFDLLLKQTITFDKFEVIQDPLKRISKIIGSIRDDRRQ